MTDDFLPDVTTSRDGKDFLVRVHTDAGMDFVDDMFGIFVVREDDLTQVVKPWRERNGARIVGPDYDELFEEIENRELDVRVR
jgi:hypothetical protein